MRDVRFENKLVPNPIVAELDAADGGVIRIYRDGLVDARDGVTYKLSPGFNNVGECEEWIAEQIREDERCRRIRENGDAYARTRDGERDEGSHIDGKVFPTKEASDVLEKVWKAHINADASLTLSNVEVAVLWAETVRRSMQVIFPEGELLHSETRTGGTS